MISGKPPGLINLNRFAEPVQITRWLKPRNTDSNYKLNQPYLNRVKCLTLASRRISYSLNSASDSIILRQVQIQFNHVSWFIYIGSNGIRSNNLESNDIGSKTRKRVNRQRVKLKRNILCIISGLRQFRKYLGRVLRLGQARGPSAAASSSNEHNIKICIISG